MARRLPPRDKYGRFVKRGGKRRSYRRKTKRSYASRAGSFLTGRSGRPMGIGARIGLTIAGVGPVAIAGVDAAQIALAKQVGSWTLTPIGKVQIGFARFINNMATGFGLDVPFQSMNIETVNGSQTMPVAAGVPKGSSWPLLTVGLISVVYDRFAGIIAGKKGGTKIPGTNYLAIGGA